MKRGIILLLLVGLTFIPYVASAQSGSTEQIYLNNVLGISFQYPGNWEINEQPSARTVTAASKADMDAIKVGKPPAGLLFTVTVSNFRLIGIQRLEDFTGRLQNIAGTPNVTP